MEVDLLDCNDTLQDKWNGNHITQHTITHTLLKTLGQIFLITLLNALMVACLSAGNSDTYCSTVAALDCIKTNSVHKIISLTNFSNWQVRC
jgi:ABC-type amino acid transport system permease subunit